MDHDKDINEKLDKVLERESFIQKYVFQIITLVFLAGGGWVGLNHVTALAEDNHAAIEEQEKDMAGVREKLTRIEVTQEHIKDELEEAKEVARENADKLDAILDELRKK